MWRKGHIGSEFCSQYLHESERRENSFLTDWKIAFPSFWSLQWGNFGRKRVIIQSRSNIDFAFILLPLTLSLFFWGMRLVSLSDVSFKLLQEIYFLKSTWKVNKLAQDKKKNWGSFYGVCEYEQSFFWKINCFSMPFNLKQICSFINFQTFFPDNLKLQTRHSMANKETIDADMRANSEF